MFFVEYPNPMGCADPGPPRDDSAATGDVAQPDAAAHLWPFRVRPDGVYRRVDNQNTVSWEWLCSPLEVVAETRDAGGEAWGRLLRITDRDGTVHEWAMPMEQLAGSGEDYRGRLLSLGLELSSARGARQSLAEYIQTARPGAKARCVPRVGWHGRAFVLPDLTIGDTAGERLLLQTAASLDHAFRVSGSLKSWQDRVARLAINNSRLVHPLSAAFAGPLLQLTGADSGGFHYRGASSTGKTTALFVAGSVWGGGGLKGYLRQWRATDNGLEAVAAAHCDCLLCLDELSQVDAKAAGAAAYMLANGAGKARAGRGGEGRPAQEWRVLFLSNGEIALADKLAEDGRGRKVTAGQEVRVIDISADALARHLKAASAEEFGTAARTFLRAVSADPEDVAAAAIKHRDDFVADRCPGDADGQVKRVAAYFGLVAAAGEIAAAAGVLPWPLGEATRGVGRCFEAWLAARGGIGAAEVMAGIAQVRAFIEAHGSSRFEPVGDAVGDKDRTIYNRAGFRKRLEDSAGAAWDYYVLAEAWQDEVCRGLDARALAKAMIARGLLIPDSDGRHHAKSERIPGYPKKMRVYHIPAAILEGDAHD